MLEKKTSFKEVSNRDILWGYIAQAVNLGAGLLLLPFVLMRFPQEEVGLWFVFLTLGSLAQLLELGLRPTLARNTAYVFSGAKELHAYGIAAKDKVDGKIDLKLLGSLLSTAKKIYKFVALLGAAIIVFGGGLYISTLIKDFPDQKDILLAWVLFSAGYIVNFYFGYVNAFLQGKGDVTESNKVLIISKIFYLLVSIITIFLDQGLSGLGVATLLAALLGRLVGLYYLNKDGAVIEASKISKPSKDLFSVLWPNTKKLGVVYIGAFLIQRFSILLASSYLGLDLAASYGMSMTILTTLLMVSVTICQIQIPLLSALQSNRNTKMLKRVMGEIYIFSWFIFFVGIAIIVFFGDFLLELVGSETKLLPEGIILILGLVLLLEQNHSIAATYLTTTNNIPFLAAAVWSGAFVALGGIILVKPMGVLGLILSQGAVQLVYNNWKWPKIMLEDLSASPFSLIISGAIRIKSRF